MASNKKGIVLIEVLAQGSAPRGASMGMAPATQIAEMALEDLQGRLESVSRAVIAAMKSVQPESCTVEFNLGIKGTSKIPIILSGEASAAFKVTLTWKKEASKASGAKGS